MKTEEKYHGSCLCGSVSVSAHVKSKSVDACHCGMCQKWGEVLFLQWNVATRQALMAMRTSLCSTHRNGRSVVFAKTVVLICFTA